MTCAGFEDGGRELLQFGRGKVTGSPLDSPERDAAVMTHWFWPTEIHLGFLTTDCKVIHLHCFKPLNL